MVVEHFQDFMKTAIHKYNYCGYTVCLYAGASTSINYFTCKWTRGCINNNSDMSMVDYVALRVYATKVLY